MPYIKVHDNLTVWHSQISDVRACDRCEHTEVLVGRSWYHVDLVYMEMMVKLVAVDHPCVKRLLTVNVKVT